MNENTANQANLILTHLPTVVFLLQECSESSPACGSKVLYQAALEALGGIMKALESLLRFHQPKKLSTAPGKEEAELLMLMLDPAMQEVLRRHTGGRFDEIVRRLLPSASEEVATRD